MKTIIKYRGGKTKELTQIMLHVPRFSGRYIEPFLGGGALFFHLEPRQAVINDINRPLMEFYRGVREDFDNLTAELKTLETLYAENHSDYLLLKKKNPEQRAEDKNEELYYRLRDMYNGLIANQYSEAAIYYFINKTAYSGMIRYNAKGEFNVPYGRYPNLNSKLITKSHHQLLLRSELFNKDFSDIFEKIQPDDFMFLDPPYDCVFSDYGNDEYKDGFAEDDHRRLASDFRNLSCKTLMIIGKTPLTEELYGKYIIDEYQKNYAVNIRNRFKSAATHIVVANYDRDQCNQQYSFYNTTPLETVQAVLCESPSPYGNSKK